VSEYIDAAGNRFDVTTAPGAVYQDHDGTPGGVVFQDLDGDRVIVGRTFYAPFTHSINPTVGPPPYWTTNAGATARPTIIDRIGVVRYCRLAEARFWGARRVENLLRGSNDLDNATYWSVNGTASVAEITEDPDLVEDTATTCYELTGNGTSNALIQTCTENGAGTSTAVLRPVKHTFSVEMRAGSVSGARLQLYVSGGASAVSQTMTLSDEWQRFSVTGTPDGTSNYSVLICPTTSGTIYVRRAQLEDMAGETADASGNVPPSEYVNSDLNLASFYTQTYNGAMVDRVQYFATENGNTVDNATKVVAEATGAAIARETLKGLLMEPQCVNRVNNSETLSGWTVNGSSLTIDAGIGTGPNGLTSGIRLTEDSASSSKYCYFEPASVTDSLSYCAQVFAKAGTQSYLRLEIMRKSGTERTAYFNLATGAIVSTSPNAKAYIFPVGNGWYLCSLVTNVSTGATTTAMRIGIASSSATATYTGTGGTIFVWGAQFHNKEHPQSYIRTTSGTATRTGYSLRFPAEGLVGLNDFAFYGEMFLWCDTGTVGKTTDGSTQGWFYPITMRAKVPNQRFSRLALTIRPYADTTYGYAIWAADRYLGEPTSALLWRPNTRYEVGDWVVPADTEVDNGNSKKIFYCMVAGTSGGSNPPWDDTFVSTPLTTPTANLTVDNDVRWQCNNIGRETTTDGGIYEPDEGTHPSVNVPAFDLCKMGVSYMSTPRVYANVNGSKDRQTTVPNPIDQSIRGDMHFPMYEMILAADTSAYAHGSMLLREIMVFNRRVSEAAIDVLVES